ncbi:galactosyltransferase-related protein [Streptomyces sp. NPDC088812]|uniref:galactosyltransferase-related protein n=1 Tax=Streptomyces sp. NPDC088812 TaxID=3365905 RepID=UPI00381777D7
MSDDILHRRAAEIVLMSVDPGARFSPPYWARDEAKVRRVCGILERSPRLRQECGSLKGKLRSTPTDWNVYATLEEAVRSALAEDAGLEGEVRDAVRRFQEDARLQPHRGERFLDPFPTDATRPEPPALPDRVRTPQRGRSRLSVVLDIRAVPGDTARLHNAQCTLAAVGDQTLPREDYRIILVEQDEHPRNEGLFAPHVDQYLYGYNDGPYNHAWGHNVGAVHDEAESDVILFMDVDVLPSRHFLEAVLVEFKDSPIGGLIPFRNLLFLEPHSTARAIDRRFSDDSGKSVRLDDLFGYRIHGPQGAASMAVRRDAFRDLNGFDESYEGWGSEDYEFYTRLAEVHEVGTMAGTLLHMHHPVQEGIARTADANKRKLGRSDRTGIEIGSLDLYSR